MTTLSGISAQPKQTLSFTLDDGSLVSMYLEYRPQQTGWFANFQWQDWRVDGIRLTASPNLLAQWQKRIPFGLAILTQGNVEPLNSTDFSNGICWVVVLNAADVQTVNGIAFSGS
ncbi:MAG: hypothetical protein EBY17_30160 [Acidobacteriia bacterium]|nr:hypothetical protein [Terriglobia bacterium]